MGQAIEIENLRASAIFEDREIRDRSDALRLLDLALINAVGRGAAPPPGAGCARPHRCIGQAGVDDAITEATAAIEGWRAGSVDAAGLGRCLVRARARLPLVRELCRDPSAPDEEVIRRVAVDRPAARILRGLDGLCRSIRGLCLGSEAGAAPRLARSNDPRGALDRTAGGACSIPRQQLLDPHHWPHGSTAAILGAVATARLATMAPAVPIAVGATLIFALATIPAFIIVEVLLPLANGFAMFALAVAPMLFLCAFLMAHEKTMLIGYCRRCCSPRLACSRTEWSTTPWECSISCIAAVVAAATAMVLWAIIAPATPEAARRRFSRRAAGTGRIAPPRRPIGLPEFETAMTEASTSCAGQPSRISPMILPRRGRYRAV